MTVPVLPPELDLVMREGWRRGAADSRVAARADAGPRLPRRRYSRTGRPWSLVLDCDRDQERGPTAGFTRTRGAARCRSG
ncbi:hypothetical protein [Methylobrevis pamukkalensis]|uniref:Uncharacterized protein n=1 Tax=Methylobrevis pamukkalensis TaxID=1439726 RepID=A0A1E3H6P6_9HYPH|nr:hypothetical protein [Methylobrevis pamukkalensis]ODN71171.1 hypothetical protein A6302_01460 [Methylobrevis pamukkalensis]